MIKQPEPNKSEILEELDDLFLALQYAGEKTAMLTTGERICVNQQRASLFRILDGHETSFVQSPTVQKKVADILHLIDKTDWEPHNDKGWRQQ
ncbi:hypothetical protein [Flavobacterium beibuense]|uniref:hypothetical protein n=1 Tax=Flavobacterium beibuense TaxID=657326 RepID=UPI003A8D8838